MPVQDEQEGPDLNDQENENEHHWNVEGIVALIREAQNHTVEEFAFEKSSGCPKNSCNGPD